MGGCLGSRSGESTSSGAGQPTSSSPSSTGGERPLYSWEKRRQEGGVDPSRYKISDVNDGVAAKSPGEVDGQHFVISNCTNATIVVFDNCDAVTIDNCKNCKIFIGPTKGSIFLRNCANIECGLICQQFRARDCRKVSCLLFCATQPIIESCTAMQFGCLQFDYPKLEDQLRAAGLNVFNNCWYNIHDFTADGKQQWSLLPTDSTVDTFLDISSLVQNQQLDSVSSAVSVVGSGVFPLTHGEEAKGNGETCLVVFFEADRDAVHKLMVEFTQRVAKEAETLSLIQTKQVKMTADDCNRVFGQWQKSYKKLVDNGPVVGMEVFGDACSSQCDEFVEELKRASPALGQQQEVLVYVSPDVHTGEQDVEQFYHFVSMVMSA